MTAAKLLDTVRRRGDDGEHGYDGGAAMVASAMAGACEGEELERRGGVWEVQRREGDRSMASPGEGSGEAASRCVAHAAVAVGHALVLLEEEEDDRGGGAGGLGRPLGTPGWTGKPFPFLLFSVFFFNTSATLLN